MKHPSLLLAFVMAASAPSGMLAQTTDGPPVNVNSVLSTLGQIKQKQQVDIKSTEGKLAQTLMATSQSPTDAVAYYINAVATTQFAGLNHEAKEIQDWKKKNEAQLKDSNFRTALCLHLMYLSLTVSHDSGVKTKDLLPGLITYTQQVLANETAMAGQEELMETVLTKSIFVRALQIGQYVTDDVTWEQMPIKVDKIFEKVILPEYRLEKNGNAIFQYWDARIQREGDEAANTRRKIDIDKFTNETKPGLQWLRAEEYVGLGMKNTAITTMVSIIQANPYHPSAKEWITEVEKMVKSLPQPSAPPQPQSATGAAPAPPTDPASATPDSTQPAQN